MAFAKTGRWPVPRPLWVRLGLMGVDSRETAVNLSWTAGGSAVCAMLYAMSANMPIWGFAMGGAQLFAAIGLRMGIRWADRQDAWPPKPAGERGP